ncbi:hypothetical protein BC941DRAFT_168084 [Chlamydoabsidia padenii]|nr:hypothetical protein BC941DRAFT_168084 [Chlamydoabsidia padenii]
MGKVSKSVIIKAIHDHLLGEATNLRTQGHLLTPKDKPDTLTPLQKKATSMYLILVLPLLVKSVRIFLWMPTGVSWNLVWSACPVIIWN